MLLFVEGLRVHRSAAEDLVPGRLQEADQIFFRGRHLLPDQRHGRNGLAQNAVVQETGRPGCLVLRLVPDDAGHEEDHKGNQGQPDHGVDDIEGRVGVRDLARDHCDLGSVGRYETHETRKGFQENEGQNGA